MTDDEPEDGLTTGNLSEESSLDAAPNFGDAFSTNGPKQPGLKTGSLREESSLDSAAKAGDPMSSDGPKQEGLSVRAQIAEKYAPALKGELGNEKMFETFLGLMQNEIRASQDATTFSSAGGPTNVQGFNGHYVVTSKPKDRRTFAPQESLPPAAPYTPWGLVIVDGVAGEVRITVGTIISDIADITVAVDITNASDVFTPSAGDKIWIEITDVHPVTEATLSSGSGWGSDAWYVTSGEDETIAMTSYHYPLWEFAATGDFADGWVPVNADLKARRLAEVNHFRIIHAAYQKVVTDFPLLVPVLVSCHRALT